MRNVVCAIGRQKNQEMIRRIKDVLGSGVQLYLLHVIDTGPRRELEEFLRRPGMRGRPDYNQKLDSAEDAASRAIAEDAARAASEAGFSAQVEILKGHPEQLIVQFASQVGAEIIVIRANEGAEGHPRIGPASVGHIARFVLDHAPCDVLLLREALIG